MEEEVEVEEEREDREEELRPLGVTRRLECSAAQVGDTVKVLFQCGPTQAKEVDDPEDVSDIAFIRITQRTSRAGAEALGSEVAYQGVQLHDLSFVRGSYMRAVVEFEARHILTVTPLYVLQDAEGWHARWPHTFAIPPRSVRVSLALYQQAQLGFHQERADDVLQAERMWVRVDAITRGRTRGAVQYVGLLERPPLDLRGLHQLDRIPFAARHVLKVGLVMQAPGSSQQPSLSPTDTATRRDSSSTNHRATPTPAFSNSSQQYVYWQLSQTETR